MSETGKTNPIARKAFEITYALFRLSARMADQTFGGSLREEATRLMANAAKSDFGEAMRSVTVIEYFIKLAAEVDLINFANAEILSREIGNLRAIIESSPAPMLPENIEVSIESIFSSIAPAAPAGEQILFVKEKNRQKDAPVVHTRIAEERAIEEESMSTSGRSEMRQTAILNLIRQSGNCRIHDIQSILPDASERTIRYDLQALAERGLIERVGNGGPAIFYRIRQTADAGL